MWNKFAIVVELDSYGVINKCFSSWNLEKQWDFQTFLELFIDDLQYFQLSEVRVLVKRLGISKTKQSPKQFGTCRTKQIEHVTLTRVT